MYCAFSLVPPHPPLYLDEMFPLRPHDVLLSTLLRMKSNPLMQMDMKLTARSKHQISLHLWINLRPQWAPRCNVPMLSSVQGKEGAGAEVQGLLKKGAGVGIERRTRREARAESGSEMPAGSVTPAPAAGIAPAATELARVPCMSLH